MPRKPIKMRSFADEQASEFGKTAAKKFNKGTFTASQTGAAALAADRNIVDAASYQSDRKRMKKGLIRKY